MADPDLPLELKHSADNRTVLDFYRDLAGGSVVYRRCRVMLLGNGGAGKTTLAKTLVARRAPGAGTVLVTHGVEQRTSGSSWACALCVLLKGPEV
jgi:ABC-type branched-subunit amino acid transport system ATPase component